MTKSQLNEPGSALLQRHFSDTGVDPTGFNAARTIAEVAVPLAESKDAGDVVEALDRALDHVRSVS
jgi:hypothetical protein